MSAGTEFAAARAMYEMAREDACAPHEGELSDDECMLLGQAQSTATGALMLTPAPDWEALAYKMEVFAAEELCDLCLPLVEPLFAALLADVRRLGGSARQ